MNNSWALFLIFVAMLLRVQRNKCSQEVLGLLFIHDFKGGVGAAALASSSASKTNACNFSDLTFDALLGRESCNHAGRFSNASSSDYASRTDSHV